MRDYLAAGDVRKADDETRALLIKMAGPGAVQRGWVYFTEVPPIPAADLLTVDALWKAASNNKFGYSVQKEMWVQVSTQLLGSNVRSCACVCPMSTTIVVNSVAMVRIGCLMWGPVVCEWTGHTVGGIVQQCGYAG